MKRALILGLAITAIGGAGLFLAGLLGISLSNTIVGVGAGVAIAVVRQSHPLLRLLGFLIGVALGVGFMALLLGGLPGGGSVMGRAVGLLIVMLVVTLVAGLSAGRIPHWTMLVGVVSLVAQFNSIAQGAPSTSSDALPSVLTSVLIMGAIGFLVSPVAEWLASRDRPEPSSNAGPPPSGEAPPSYYQKSTTGGAA